jgi:hypothetical protein
MTDKRRDERVRDLAYRIWEARGCEPGGELDDWLAAERQLGSIASATPEPPIKVPNPPEGEASTVEAELTKIASRDAPGG